MALMCCAYTRNMLVVIHFTPYYWDWGMYRLPPRDVATTVQFRRSYLGLARLVVTPKKHVNGLSYPMHQ